MSKFVSKTKNRYASHVDDSVGLDVNSRAESRFIPRISDRSMRLLQSQSTRISGRKVTFKNV